MLWVGSKVNVPIVAGPALVIRDLRTRRSWNNLVSSYITVSTDWFAKPVNISQQVGPVKHIKNRRFRWRTKWVTHDKDLGC